MANDFKATFQGINALALQQHFRDGIWYPSQPWGIVKHDHLAPLFLAHASRSMVGECVSYLIDLARIPIYDSTVSTSRRRYFYDTCFRPGAGQTGTACAPQQLNLPCGEYDRARELLVPSLTRMDQLKQRVVGPSGSTEVLTFLIVAGFSQNTMLNQNGVTGSFWGSPEFAAFHAPAAANKRHLLATRSPAVRRPHPVVRFP